MIMGRTSVVQIISNSKEFRSWFERNVQAMSSHIAGKVKNLRAAKHRFETFSKPLARLVLFLPAFLKTAQEIASKRDDKPEGRAAAAWLSALTPANLVLLAMLADAGDEGLGLIRAADNEAVDIATMQATVSSFLRNIETLFDNEMATQTESFTKHCIDYLNSDDLPIFSGNSVRTIGKVTETDLRKCFDHMKCWATLAREVVLAEFPDHDIFCAFGIFNVSAAGNVPSIGPYVQRLAKVFHVDEGMLLSQLCDHRQMAQRCVALTGCSSRDAWKQVVQNTQACAKTKRVYPIDALLPVLTRYCAWTASSSGVEQLFSRVEGSGVLRTPASEHTAEMRARFICFSSMSAPERALAVGRARELWCTGWGPERITSKERLHKGVKRRSRPDDMDHELPSEASWLRKRRCSVNLAAQGMEPAVVPADHRPAAWTGAHESELQKQRKKQTIRKVEALMDGVLLEPEITAELEAAVADRVSKDVRNDANNRRAARRTSAKASMVGRSLDWQQLMGLSAWVDSDCGPDHTLAEMRSTLLTHGLSIAYDRLHACVIVVRDPTKPGERNQLAAMLRAGWLVSASQVIRSQGSFLKYRYGFKAARDLYISDEFTTRHPKITAAVRQACSWPGSCWKLIATPDEARVRFGIANTRAGQVTMLVTAGEGRLGMPRKMHVLTKAGFMASLSRLDWRCSGGS